MAATMEGTTGSGEAVGTAAQQLRIAAATRKCWACGCLRHALDTIERAMPEPSRPEVLAASIAGSRSRLMPQRGAYYKR
jgi:hypothetical protein